MPKCASGRSDVCGLSVAEPRHSPRNLPNRETRRLAILRSLKLDESVTTRRRIGETGGVWWPATGFFAWFELLVTRAAILVRLQPRRSRPWPSLRPDARPGGILDLGFVSAMDFSKSDKCASFEPGPRKADISPPFNGCAALVSEPRCPRTRPGHAAGANGAGNAEFEWRRRGCSPFTGSADAQQD